FGADVGHVDDVRMADARRDLALALEARAHDRIVGDRARQHLDGDALLQVDVLRLVDRAHPAASEETNEPVLPEDRALGELGFGRHARPRLWTRLSGAAIPRVSCEKSSVGS